MTLQDIYAPIADDLKAVRSELEVKAAEVVERHRPGAKYKLYARGAVRHIFKRHGKLLRPALALLSYRAAGGEVSEATQEMRVRLASVFELVHTASLVHDDILDESHLRRGGSSVNGEYGIKIGVLVGDILFSLSFQQLLDVPSTDAGIKDRLFRIINDLTQRMCLGEMFQQRIFKREVEVDFSDYLEVIEQKTALLMAAACEAGAVAAGADDKTVAALRAFGLEFGFAFQLRDDVDDRDHLAGTEGELRAEWIRRLDNARVSLEDVDRAEELTALADFIMPKVRV